MTSSQFYATKCALVAIAISAVLSSCGGATSSSGTVTSSGPGGGTVTSSGPGGGSTSSGPGGGSTSSGPGGGSTSSGPGGGSTSSGPGGGSTSSGPGGGSTSSGPSVSGSTATATTITVPDVDSQPIPEAMLNLRQAGLTVGLQEQKPNLYVPYQSVITTDPAAGSTEPAGFAVNLLVSAGPPSCQGCRLIQSPMPDVIGQTLHQAITTLAEQDLSLDSYTAQASTAPPGEVIESDPLPGTYIFTNADITLVISSGSSTPTTSTPTTSTPTTSSPAASPSPDVPAPGS
jgi:PASTA domain